MDWKDFCNNLKEILDIDKKPTLIKYSADDEKICMQYIIEGNNFMEFTYTKKKFIKDYKNITHDGELIISNDKYYEVPLMFKDNIIHRYDDIIGQSYKDHENKIEYIIDTPSNQFFIKIIELGIKPNFMMLRRSPISYYMTYKLNNKKKNKSIFDLLKFIYRDCITLQLKSSESNEKKYFQNLIDSFIFNINYNTDMGIVLTYDLENMHGRGKNNKFRNTKIKDIPTPKRIYKKELIEQYNMASISEDPFIKFICYYHIIEHFYEVVYKEDLIESVKEQLTRPNFSIKDKKEINKLIENIKDKIKYNREEFDGNELDTLELVIDKYIDIDELMSAIINYNPDLVEYYDKNNVVFSNGIPINFKDTSNVKKNISKRIYFTRNSLVHYKSNDFNKTERGIYRPFQDKEALLKEIPLIRIIAEEIIIKNSQII